MINTGCHGENGQWKIRAGGVNEFACAILSRFPIDCPESKRVACAELLTRINYNLLLGCFEFDLDDGKIYFKTNMPYEKEPPAAEVLDNLLICNISTMDRYFPLIMQVIYAGVAPSKAMADYKQAADRAAKAKAKPKTPKLPHKPRFQLN